jgi:hypothetical protein
MSKKRLNEDFKVFRRHYLDAVREFQLSDYDHYVRLGDSMSDDEGVIAAVYAHGDCRSATVCFVGLPPDTSKKRKRRDKLLRAVARHEATHVLLNELSELAASRSATRDQLTAAEEKLVVRLGNIGL